MHDFQTLNMSLELILVFWKLSLCLLEKNNKFFGSEFDYTYGICL